MDPEKIIKQLREEGYENLYTWCDPPGTFYSWHTHPDDEVRVVYRGSMVIGTEEGEFLLKEGDRLEVKAGTRHWAKTEEGVCYVCGTKRPSSGR
nr:cupin domain-containing protein [Thermocrinis albus]